MMSLLTWLDRWLAPPPDPARIAWLKGAVFAHRGLHNDGLADGLVENSMGAFLAAIAARRGIECDVQRSADDEAIVFHDENLERLTDEHGPLNARSADALTKLALRKSGETIPRLSALLALVGGRVPLLIEVKLAPHESASPLCEAVAEALKNYRGAYGVMSFDPRVVRWFSRHAPKVPRGLVMNIADWRGFLGPLRRHATLWLARPDFMALNIADVPGEFAESQRQRGIPIACWTVRNLAQFAKASAAADAAIAEGEGMPETNP